MTMESTILNFKLLLVDAHAAMAMIWNLKMRSSPIENVYTTYLR
jgi:hypothetical protein